MSERPQEDVAPDASTECAEDAQPRTSIESVSEGDTGEAGGRRTPQGVPFDSERAREAAEKRWSKEREREARAQRDAELDKLTVRARLATGVAGELSAANLRSVLANLLHLAQGQGHVAVQASRLLLDLAQASVHDDGGSEPEGVAWADMTPAQRAAARVALDKHILQLAALEEAQEKEGVQEQGTPADEPDGAAR